MMRPTAIALGLAAAAVAAACGEGRAIFNVDVFSFIGQDVDTIPYGAPPLSTLDTVTTPVEVTMAAGLGDATVDTVTISAAANALNSAGEGSIAFQIFFAADSASTYTGTPQFDVNSGPLGPGADTVSVGGSFSLSDDLFRQQSLWVGIRVRATSTTAVALQGELALTALDLRIVFGSDFP